jgi:hypothetical protein
VTRRDRPFAVIEGTPAPDSPAERSRAAARATNTPGILQCPRCGGRALIQVVLGVEIVRGQPSGGTSGFICAVCLAGGEQVRVW